MINELYQLSKVIEQAGEETYRWHQDYLNIAAITSQAPCAQVIIQEGTVLQVNPVDAELGRVLRRFGNNQRSYPCMNLRPLYKLTDENKRKEIASLKAENINSVVIRKLKSWCTENNWDEKKFRSKYKNSIQKTAKELGELAAQNENLSSLIVETDFFSDSDVLFNEMEKCIWEKLEFGEDIDFALKVLFFTGDKEDKNKLSVAFDAQSLIDCGISAVSATFVKSVNDTLMKSQENRLISSDFDAFGYKYDDRRSDVEKPMPKVRLKIQSSTILRTVNEDEPTQWRYHRYGAKSFPISPEARIKFKSALEWVSDEEREHITWKSISKNEMMFVFPDELPSVPLQFVNLYDESDDGYTFEAKTKEFLKCFKETKGSESVSVALGLKVFILKAVSKGCTKVVYTKQTDSRAIEKCSEQWNEASRHNLPTFRFGQPKVLFPLQVADVLNYFWKQNGELIKKDFKPVKKYHGLDLLLDLNCALHADFHMLAQQAVTVAGAIGNQLARNEKLKMMSEVKAMLSLAGLLLYKNGVRKDDYMTNLPYLYGQLLKAADELHILYCQVVRNEDVPPQLVGSSLFQAASDAPLRTLTQLQQRLMPYYTWAKTYRFKEVNEKNKESWRAGWLCKVCEQTMSQLATVWTAQTRFNDEEKVQLFIGYLAEFPKKEKDALAENEEEKTGEVESNGK